MLKPGPTPAEPTRLGGLRYGVYASGNFGKNLLWGALEVALLFILTDLLGLSPALAGGMVLASLLLDAVLDPLIARQSDRSRGRLGRYGAYIVLGAPAAGLSFALLLALPQLGISHPAVVMAALMLFRASYALVDLPHNALLARVTSHSRVRARVAGARFFFSSLASLTVALSIAPLARQGGLSAPLLALYGGLAGTASAGVLILAWAAVRRRDQPPPAARMLSFTRGLGALLRHPPYLLAVGAGVVAVAALPLFGKTLLYLTTHVLGDPALASPVLAVGVAGQFAGLPLWTWLSGRWEKARVLQAAHLTCAGAFAALLLLGPAPQHLVLAAFLAGIGASGVYSIVWGMVADCADDVERRTGERPEALAFALAILLQKVAIALAAAGLGLLLQMAGYADAPSGAAARTAIVATNAAAPLIGALACAALLSGYGLTHARHAVVIRSLARRRARTS
ncbi:MAG: MFS transporter [Phenylobacterium sp.]|uniref:MFS transporter n=1 Tax=Phenylobacterium sp. TaxID=1871053 RepID=UPI001821F90E|nr:MFS transporter [Phenylobacterium sp.]MBA4793698.1 MFS transporter [Phenylobacterium sp.]